MSATRQLQFVIAFSLAALMALVIALPAPAAQAPCGGRQINTVKGCQHPVQVKRQLEQIVKSRKTDNRLQAVIARVDIGGRTLLRRAFGQSQAGVPATPAMNFRIGSMTIPMLTTVVYQLREQGKLRLTDPVSRWLPDLPHASKVTVRNLMNNTSGYYDWIQGNDQFVDKVFANPFRIWSEKQLLDTALGRGTACEPGACFNYAHTNFLILARIVRKILPGETLVAHLQQRVLRPLKIKASFSRLAPIPTPALGAYLSDRGFFEQTTGWSPSWGLGNGMLATTSIDNVARIASGVLAGRTLGTWARKDLVRRYAPGLGPDGRFYFAQGLIYADGWLRQNPFFNGYMGNVAWFPGKRIAVSLVGTRGAHTTSPSGVNVTDEILVDIAGYLTPSNSPAPPPAS